MEKANTTTGAATTKLDNTPKSKMTTYGKVIQKADTKMVVNDLLVQEDDYTELYWRMKKRKII